MIRKSTSDFCRDDVSMIENYQEAIESDEGFVKGRIRRGENI